MGVLMGGSKHTIVSTNKILAGFMLYKSVYPSSRCLHLIRNGRERVTVLQKCQLSLQGAPHILSTLILSWHTSIICQLQQSC